MPRAHQRFLVLGLDGGTFRLLDPLMQAGDLPFLSGLARSGLKAPLESVYPAKTIPAWYSFATGRDPGQLGIFGFMEPDGGPGRSHLVRTFRPTEAIWDTLSRAGAKVGVLNLPLGSGYPVHGFVMPGFFSDASDSFPRALRGEIEGALGCPYPGELPVFRGTQRAEWVGEATRAIERRGQAAAMLSERNRPDFLFVLFRETDRIEHQLWNELERPVDQIPDDLRRFWRTVDAACARVDRAFRADAGPAVTMVVSDHGHGAVRSDFLTNRWLAQQGFLKFRPEAEPHAGRHLVAKMILKSQEFRVGRLLGKPVVELLRHRPLAPIGKLIGGPSSFEATAPSIDWDASLAYSYPVPEGIYLNPYNRKISPDDRVRIVQELKQRLTSYPDAKIEVFEPKELYRGRNFARAPALLIRVDGMATEPWMDFRFERPLIRDRPGFFYGSGTHRMEGILIAGGDGVRPSSDGTPLSLLDLAPTILEGMGHTPSAEMSGRSFVDRLGLAA